MNGLRGVRRTRESRFGSGDPVKVGIIIHNSSEYWVKQSTIISINAKNEVKVGGEPLRGFVSNFSRLSIEGGTATR
jgi:hypothetical protein